MSKEDFRQFGGSTPELSINGLNSYGRLIDIYDGDTLTCIFPIFKEHYYRFNIRLANIDTMEMRDSNIENKKKAYEARDRILSLCCDNNLKKECNKKDIKFFLENNEIYIWIKCYNFDKYGKYGIRYRDNETIIKIIKELCKIDNSGLEYMEILNFVKLYYKSNISYLQIEHV